MTESNYRLTEQDFNVFTIDGLEPRMSALIEHVRPKLENLGDYFSDYFTQQTGEKYYAHVAKHLRRTTNPPNDTWVAFGTNKRGYKMLPHFQIGLFHSHAFVLYGLIYESNFKQEKALQWKEQLHIIRNFPDDFIIKKDHMKEDFDYIKDLTDEEIKSAIDRLANVKKGELLFGKIYLPDDRTLKTDKTFKDDVMNTFDELIKIM